MVHARPPCRRQGQAPLLYLGQVTHQHEQLRASRRGQVQMVAEQPVAESVGIASTRRAVVSAWRIAIARPSINAWPTRTQSLQVPLPCFNRLRAALPCRTTSLAISRSLQASLWEARLFRAGRPSGDERKCAAANLRKTVEIVPALPVLRAIEPELPPGVDQLGMVHEQRRGRDQRRQYGAADGKPDPFHSDQMPTRPGRSSSGVRSERFAPVRTGPSLALAVEAWRGQPLVNMSGGF